MENNINYLIFNFYFDHRGILGQTQKSPDPTRDPDLVQIGGVAELFLIDMDTLSIEQDNINGVPRIGVCTVTKEGAGQQREFLRTYGRRQDEEGAEQKRRQGSNVVLIVLDCGHYFAFADWVQERYLLGT